MQIVQTKNHLIYSANKGKPAYACLGICRKVWWKNDVPSDLAIVAVPACPQCGGPLTSDIPDGHHEVVTDQAGALNKGGAIVMNAGLKLGS